MKVLYKIKLLFICILEKKIVVGNGHGDANSSPGWGC